MQTVGELADFFGKRKQASCIDVSADVTSASSGLPRSVCLAPLIMIDSSAIR